MKFFLFFALLLALALLLFAFQNSTVITLTFIAWTFTGSLAFILALTFSTGMLSGIFVSIPTLWMKVRENRRQKKRIQELEGKIIGYTQADR